MLCAFLCTKNINPTVCFSADPGFSVGLAVALRSFSVSVRLLVWFVARPAAFIYAVLCAAPVSLHAPHTAHTHLTHHTNRTLTTHTLHTPHIHVHRSPHPPHQHLSPHSTLSCAYAILRWHTTRCMPWGCTLCLLIKCDQMHPKL